MCLPIIIYGTKTEKNGFQREYTVREHLTFLAVRLCFFMDGGDN